jgi:uncharacterized protein (DUF1330 family)
MAGYIIADVQVTDPEAFEEYRKLVPATIAKYGGEYVVRGGRSEVLEGDWTPHRTVILRFDSFEKAKAWHDSEEYRIPKSMRHAAAISSVIVVEGV